MQFPPIPKPLSHPRCGLTLANVKTTECQYMDVAASEPLIIGQLEFHPDDHLVVFSIQRDQGEGVLHGGRGDERVEKVKSM